MTQTPKPIFLRDYTPPPYCIGTVELFVDLFDETARVRSRLACERNHAAGNAAPGPLVLAGRDLALKEVRLDGRVLAAGEYERDPESLTIAAVPDRFRLEIETEVYPGRNTALEGLYRSGPIFCTQCEAEGFRRITYFLDRPDVLARYTTTITADRQQCPVLLANGNLVETGELGSGRHFARWEDPFPKPSYLFALVAGKLARIEDSFVCRSGRRISLAIFVEPHNRDRCDHAMRSLKKAMRWDEEEYGLEYDLDQYMIVAVDDFNMGAMENKGLNIFNSKYVLASPETATDDDYANIEAVIGHEYFHNWTGNRVTCRDWFQLSLKEGLTVFRDQQFSAAMTSPAVKRIHDVRLLRNHQFPEDAGPMAHPVRPESYIEINNFYTVTVYEKGAEVIRMLSTLLGPDLFRRGVRLYLERHDGQAATTDDFVRAMEDVSGRDLGQFRRWYTQAGTPELTVAGDYDEQQGKYTLTVRQHCPPTPGQPEKRPFHIPLAVGLLDQAGNELPFILEGRKPTGLATEVLEVRRDEETFCFRGVAARPVPSLLRGFSAPVRLLYNYSAGELRSLLAHDRDPFCRWEAGQLLAVRLLMALVEERRQGRDLVIDQDFLSVFRGLLRDRGLEDGHFAVQLLTLPSEEYLAGLMEVVDVDGIHAARRFVRRQLAARLDRDFLSVYEGNGGRAPYRYDAVLAGRRRLKNLCLDYLVQTGEAEARGLALRQFREADNMSDTLAALGALAHSGSPEREEVLAAFADRWRDEPLVMDKWFSVQATAPLPETLDRVRRLMDHPCFTIRNPNRVRALIGSFAAANPVCFHAASGEGYRFLADQVLALDPLNPQTAARLLGWLSRWRRYDAGRRELMRAELDRILGSKKLSRDVYEVASKSLAG